MQVKNNLYTVLYEATTNGSFFCRPIGRSLIQLIKIHVWALEFSNSLANGVICSGQLGSGRARGR